MEEGLIDKSHWFCRQPSIHTQRMNRALMSLFAWCTVHRVIAHRCPSCSRVELTAP